MLNKKKVILLLSAFFLGNFSALWIIGQPVNHVPVTKPQLGKQLFFEKALSLDSTVSCGSCHIPAYAFADTVPFSKGYLGRLGKRNTPSAMNVSARSFLFADGRAESLEQQVHFPVGDSNEMNFSLQGAVQRLNSDSNYQRAFKALYGGVATGARIEDAIAAFERTLETSHTPLDRYMAGNKKAMSAAAIRGRTLFMSKKAKCFDCHFSPDFTGDEFRNIGLFDGETWNDSGRYVITHNRADIGKFKVPGLRNVAATAPYMHNGAFKTLKDVIEYYDNPLRFVPHPINADSLLAQPLHLTAAEKSDLLQFLLALTDDRFKRK
ncbi:MAG: cytochrome-c peroxidase [Chitinophagia bacterium]|nr:cytochrome-c peroxidase [Chitinophagia bacterium]